MIRTKEKTSGPDGASSKVLQQLEEWEHEEREKLGIDRESEQWADSNPRHFSRDQREHTTLLISGLTYAHDIFVRAAFASAGYCIEVLDVPDQASLQMGKEYGNRGQCNPTYFTVGNLIKKLTQLRDGGLTVEEINQRYLFITAGACGPCRFGMYVTEYRKALRDAGFDGFRVLLFSQSGRVDPISGDGLEIDRGLALRCFTGIILGDILNALKYRIRPYEVNEGATDSAMEEAQGIIVEAIEKRRSLIRAAWKVRRVLSRIEVDRTRVKPRVAIIGEFWAMTTEGAGNYELQKFLEQEGAEVEIQVVSNWLMYLLWEGRVDTDRRVDLETPDEGRHGLKGVNVLRRKLALWGGEKLIRGLFGLYAKIMGLHDYPLTDADEVARISHDHYDTHLRGGEGHMEVGKLIHNVIDNKVTMTLSVKPFGCMPSSGVSDGVQSLITELHPAAIFLPIETSGDAAVNVYSRIQMQLFKARKAAEAELDTALESAGVSRDEFEARGRTPRYRNALHRSPHKAGCTAADLAHEVVGS